MSPPAPPAVPSPALPSGLAALTALALDLRWTWNHSGDELWRRLDPAVWERTRHPSVVLQTVPRERLERALNEAVKNENYERAAQVRDELRNLKSE